MAIQSILFVCTGNTCRSPMAEAIARHELEKAGLEDIRVSSAGTRPGGGDRPCDAARGALGGLGIEVGVTQPQQVTAQLASAADLVLGMSRSHVQAVEGFGGKGTVRLLGRYGENGEDISDPFGKDDYAYAVCRDQIAACVRNLIAELRCQSR